LVSTFTVRGQAPPQVKKSCQQNVILAGAAAQQGQHGPQQTSPLSVPHGPQASGGQHWHSQCLQPSQLGQGTAIVLHLQP
jgi:hypothetical protein